jgi:hypothetical protein
MTNDSAKDAMRGCLHAVVVPIEFTPPAVEKHTPKHNARETKHQLSVAVREGTVPDEDGSALTHVPQTSIKTEQAGKSYRKPYHEKLEALRRDPKNCGRCGKPNSNGHKQCDKCREYQRRYKIRLKEKAREWTPAECVAMVRQCRREVSKLRGMIKQMQRVSKYKQRREWMLKKLRTKYANAFKEISKQELAEINHAYASETD